MQEWTKNNWGTNVAGRLASLCIPICQAVGGALQAAAQLGLSYAGMAVVASVVQHTLSPGRDQQR